MVPAGAGSGVFQSQKYDFGCSKMMDVDIIVSDDLKCDTVGFSPKAYLI